MFHIEAKLSSFCYILALLKNEIMRVEVMSIVDLVTDSFILMPKKLHLDKLQTSQYDIS